MKFVDNGVVLKMTPSGPVLDVEAMRRRGMRVPDDALRGLSEPAQLAEINKRNRRHYCRARDADVPVEGQWHGTHPAGCKYNIETNGELSVYDASENLVCVYQPGAWSVVEDENGVHVGRTGNHNPLAGPTTPEKVDESAQDGAPSILRRMNMANTRFWAKK
jgi:hypothetical protein